jgi:hypothetical protein
VVPRPRPHGEENIEITDERFDGKNAAEVALAAQDGEILGLKPEAHARRRPQRRGSDL